MRIGLVDVDGHNFPNLALMKISTWEKSQGNNVEWANFFNDYDRVYRSKVFTFSEDDPTVIRSPEIISGGTGYGLSNKLPEYIEKQFPDYSLYNITDTAYGLLTRGCPRGCKFCIVGEKEGLAAYKVADLKDFWNGQKNITLLDPNILAAKEWAELFEQLEESKAWVDFTQGLDIRLMTREKAGAINKLKVKMIHFAWDNYEFKTYEKLKEFRSHTNLDKRKLIVYVLVNFNTTIEQDLDRIYKLRELEYQPYVMIYDKDKLKQGHQIRRMQRWVNSKYIFRSCEKFEDYGGKTW